MASADIDWTDEDAVEVLREAVARGESCWVCYPCAKGCEHWGWSNLGAPQGACRKHGFRYSEAPTKVHMFGATLTGAAPVNLPCPTCASTIGTLAENAKCCAHCGAAFEVEVMRDA